MKHEEQIKAKKLSKNFLINSLIKALLYGLDTMFSCFSNDKYNLS